MIMRAKGLFFGKIIGLAVLVAIATPMISFADGKTSGEHLVVFMIAVKKRRLSQMH